MIITKTFTFDSAHYLPHVPAGHKCGRMHGHTYRVTIEISGAPGAATGWLCDFADIAAAWKPIEDAVDHRLLNEVEGLDNPTSEALAPWLLRRFRAGFKPHGCELLALTLHESCTTTCRVTTVDLR